MSLNHSCECLLISTAMFFVLIHFSPHYYIQRVIIEGWKDLQCSPTSGLADVTSLVSLCVTEERDTFPNTESELLISIKGGKQRLNLCLSVERVPSVSHGSFFQEQMSSPVRRMAWSWCRPSLPPRVDCQWQKLFSVWSAWWLITKPSCEMEQINGSRVRDTTVSS